MRPGLRATGDWEIPYRCLRQTHAIFRADSPADYTVSCRGISKPVKNLRKISSVSYGNHLT